MKKIKVLFVVILTLLMSLSMLGLSSVNAEGDVLYLKVYGDSNARRNGLFTVTNKSNLSGNQGNQVFKLVGKLNSAADDSNAYSNENENRMIYCLKEGIGLADAVGEKTARYDVQYNLEDDIPSTYKANLPQDANNYNKMAWVLENLVDPYDETAVRALFEDIETYYGKDLDIDTLLNNTDKTKLIDVIEVSQQSALWKFTNAGDQYEPADSPTFRVNSSGYNDVHYYQGAYNPYLYLYSYLVNKATKAVNDGYTYDQEKTNQDVKINVSSKQDSTTSTEDYLIGPFTITGMSLINDDNGIIFKDISALADDDKQNESQIDACADITNFNIYNANKQKITTGSLTAKVKSNGEHEFYIGVPKTSTITDVAIIANATVNDREVKIWTSSNDTSRKQPVAVIKDKTKPLVARASFIITHEKYDLALRKFITKIERDGQDVYNPDVYAERVPVITEANLQKFINGESSFSDIVTTPDTKTTVAKLHKKTVLDVKPGDIITYTIRVYNEGNTDAKNVCIADQWDANYGLEYVDSEGWTRLANNAYYTIDSGTINKFFNSDGTHASSIDYHDFTIKCRVKADAPINKTFKNVAEIYNSFEHIGDIDCRYNNIVAKYNIRKAKSYNVDWAEEGKGYEDDDDFEQVRIPESPKFDLALRKYITKVTGSNGVEKTIASRVPDVSAKNISDYADGKSIFVTTVEKDHTKEPVVVEVGDTVLYNITIYNEGQVDGTATEIKDYLPEGLDFKTDSEINTANGWTANGKVVTTTKLADQTINKFNGTTVDSKTVQIECVVNSNATANNLKNIAEITADNGDDIDSTPNDLTTDQRNNYNPGTSEQGKGYEDDDDYEDLRIAPKPGFDLALRKYIVSVNGTPSNRVFDNIDKSKLNISTTTAEYKHRKDAVEVKAGDVIKYRVATFNESQERGYVYSIKDYLPSYLEFVPDERFAKEGEATSTTQYIYDFDETNYVLTITKYRATQTVGAGNYLWDLDPFNDETKAMDSEYIEFDCKVKNNYAPTVDTYLTNVATMTYSNKGGTTADEEIADRDSSDERFTVPGQDKLVNTSETAYIGTSGKTYLADPDYFYTGQEDDDDFEKLLVRPDIKQKFDLALRKFITGLNNGKEVTKITDREPEITQDALKNLAEGTTQFDDGQTAVKKHTKEPIQIRKGYSIIYTIRVYNEGDIDGTATEITDYLPEGLNLKADSAINKQYGWTADSKDPKKVTTNYLANKNIKAFSKEKNREGNYEIFYEDVQIECTVIDTLNTKTNLKNVAEITDDTDEDRDSTPENLTDDQLKDYKPGTSEDGKGYEDDDDYEDLCVYDLALRKWVTTAIVIEDNVKKVMYTGHKAEDDPESIVKVELNDKRINSAVIKFIYSIRITNEGAVDAKCEEITDYIPEGLKFVKEDNPDWVQDSKDERVIRTDKLKNTTLKPGEAAEVEVALTWINDENNIGVKINTAEISKDDGLDIDSEPNNKVDGEDDIDTAPVALTIVTGSKPFYISLIAGVLFIIGSGIVVIKKVVL